MIKAYIEETYTDYLLWPTSQKVTVSLVHDKARMILKLLQGQLFHTLCPKETSYLYYNLNYLPKLTSIIILMLSCVRYTTSLLGCGFEYDSLSIYELRFP